MIPYGKWHPAALRWSSIWRNTHFNIQPLGRGTLLVGLRAQASWGNCACHWLYVQYNSLVCTAHQHLYVINSTHNSLLFSRPAGWPGRQWDSAATPNVYANEWPAHWRTYVQSIVIFMTHEVTDKVIDEQKKSTTMASICAALSISSLYWSISVSGTCCVSVRMRCVHTQRLSYWTCSLRFCWRPTVWTDSRR